MKEKTTKIEKTNAIRILQQKKIPFTLHTYSHDGEAVSGDIVANLINIDANRVFKTLVAVGVSKQNYVFVIPVLENLDLKKAAKLVNEKSIELVPVKELLQLTGYVRGGCSPVGMKKQFKTYFHSTCTNFDTIVFSGGKIGLQIETDPKQIIKLINGFTSDIC